MKPTGSADRRCPTPATSRRTRPFTARRLGQARRAAVRPARSSPAWTTTNDYRGWDLWIEGDRVGMHIVNKWPGRRRSRSSRKTPLPAEPVGTTSPSPTTARRRPPASKIYFNGQPQPTTSQPTRSRARSGPTVPLKIGQRHTGAAAATDVALAGPAALRPRLSPAGGRAARASGAGGRCCSPSPPTSAPTPRSDELFDWWLATLDEPYRELDAELAKLQQEEAAIKARGTIAHVMNEKDGRADGVHPLPRRVRQAARPGEGRRRPTSLPPMPDDLPRNRLGLAQWLLRAGAPADGPRDGEPLLAGGLRHRPGADERRLRHHRRAADPPRAARLAGGRVPRERLGREAVLQAARHVARPTARPRSRRRRSWRRTATTGCCRAARGSAWTPR